MNIGYFFAIISFFAAVIGVAEDESILLPVCGVIVFSAIWYMESKL